MCAPGPMATRDSPVVCLLREKLKKPEAKAASASNGVGRLGPPQLTQQPGGKGKGVSPSELWPLRAAPHSPSRRRLLLLPT